MHPALNILKIPTAPHHEHLVADFVRTYLEELGISYKEDRRGNIVASLLASKQREGIAFSVHMDHPGFGIAEIKNERVICDFLGGVPKEYFRKDVPVEFFNKLGLSIGFGEVSHVITWERKNRKISVLLKKGQVELEGFGMWRLPVMRNSRTHIINRVCDDLAGCAAVLAMLSELVRRNKKQKGRGKVYAIFTRREEIGLEGAFEVSAQKIIPKKVPIISIETSRALSNAPQGEGPIIRVGDRSSIFDPEITARLCKLGSDLRLKDPKIKFQRKLMDGGTCEATAFLEDGYRAGGLCVALGNYHNCHPNGRIAAEDIRFDDWNGLVRIMTEAARDLPLVRNRRP
jgi:putative aminopeptidase FrvX